MIRWLYTLTAAVALIGAGLVHGFWTNRWVEDRRRSRRPNRLPNLPMTIGDWQATTIEVKPGRSRHRRCVQAPLRQPAASA